MDIWEYLRSNAQRIRANGATCNEGRYPTIEDYLLAKGKVFDSDRLTPEENGFVTTLLKGRKFGKDPFTNARRLLEYAPDRLVYAEGMVMMGMFPKCWHGWAMIGNKILDVTGGRILGSLPKGYVYLGVVFRTTYVLDRKGGGSILDDWEAGWPLLYGDTDMISEGR